jgi:Protein of unknown function (DUF3455)
MRSLRLTAALILGSVLATAQVKDAPPQVPEVIRAPAGVEVALSVRASGWQIYTCKAGADGKLSWTLKAPEAELRDQGGKVIGQHFAGPTWKLKDGSAVTGKATAHADSPDADSVPWLLVTVTSHSGNGLLDNVTTIQRIHTHGGKAPAEGCDAAHPDAETKSSYTADYYFYAPAPGR